jgi:outer membrane protein OmpA-like peptidoglycan-associated protein
VEVALIGAVMALILVFHAPAPPIAQSPQVPQVVQAAVTPPQPGPLPVTREIVIVLPDANGHVGTVVVERGEERIVLNEAYATSRITADGHMRREKLPEPEVRATFASVVTALPERPVSFLLYFVRGSDMLTDGSKVELDRMLVELRRRTAPDVVVIGHTDRLGKDQKNDQLSIQRAERVKADLVRQGIGAGRIRVAGRGEREPVVPTADGVDEPRNRRVEINVR